MRTVKKYLHGVTVAKALTRHAPKVVLPFEARRRSRQKLLLDTGEELALALDRGTVLRDGDILVVDDGKFVLVQAAQETVCRVTAKSATQLARAAYHLGNRHILVEIGPGYLQLEPDPVLVDMLLGLGDIHVATIEDAFEPDAGAYGGGHKHGHDASFAEDYALAQAAYIAHEPAKAHDGHQPHGEPAGGHSHSHRHDHAHPSHDGEHDHAHCDQPAHSAKRD